LPETKIIISGDREASYESVVSVIDAVKKAGISGLSLKTEIGNQESQIRSRKHFERP